ncbi:tRNA 5-methoxyuridine(34)/uridine 5-oxyacetic acid(34) synthase CmoB [Marinibactrum halimedae]|uniref:tRNA U34 carboxymethyltransferase n=1 Tax=Marinibactrum halimedae TaxID=1444977 RepID=A0AA37WM04_9GAMM|nr:tRNA 5-methoxyuridine(34)/uridine 5-oxyacetic acid(34) synthase CmoB [Marinibactrum halimedae]MCD9458406.1 tRNA 5-methoxyuridine(34)/uridine 5-oxyacetic acid(34) synthase CmoB [Marinibactrum halimedae]GLS26103.1 tRNA U34 carboxymethyltransferase [Marinibactrum halimedae]
MLNYFDDFLSWLPNSDLSGWEHHLPDQIKNSLNERRFGDLPGWQQALEALPTVPTSEIDLTTGIHVGTLHDTSDEDRYLIRQLLQDLIPWRKGPYNIHGTHIDTEWRSDWKWDRVLPHLSDLKNRLILDVGCGNGYHCWRMLGEGAQRVIGIDPSPRFIVQFLMIKHFMKQSPVDVLPLGIEALPPKLEAFDTTFSMGVLYHRRSPIDHLIELKDTLKPGGELVLETLVIEGGNGDVLVPPGRYAMMNNVWFLPSCDSLKTWMEKVGFNEVQMVDLNKTTLEEQRQTEWMRFHSLAQFLDPNDHTKTAEGHPAPLRAIMVAKKPG